ncbi:MAG: antibiotic biosynthesis monooxygenase [Aquabacterium sp.]|uniref:putative quinol monooxygenase n=1 Tax=Aquabacterium sp. TaxID=1872578 RepID=UPI00122576D1|nr:putative quinol monooxygenase [Aquabacterium sp.]TAK82452.1 MAG: antibiotic biosynthesis monooxygenase [Aquabacterium sp.]
MTYHVLVQFDVPSDKRSVFESAANMNAQSVDKEPGTLRFEIIRDEFNKNRYYFDEMYADESAFHAHCQNESLGKFLELIDSYAFGPVILFKGNRTQPK